MRTEGRPFLLTALCLFISLLLAINIFIRCIPVRAHASEAEAAKDAEWAARVVSVEGTVEARRASETTWSPVHLDDTYREGDMVRVGENSRAAVVLQNGSVLRLDQNTVITFVSADREETLLLRVIGGSIHFFSRKPKKLKVITPFMNAAIGGTEFVIKVDSGGSSVSVFEGSVTTENEVGSLTLTGGQSAFAREGSAPESFVVVRPRDAVHWAIYYPPVLDFQRHDFAVRDHGDWAADVGRSIESYWENDIASAFSSLPKTSDGILDPRFFTYRAALLLSVGRVNEAETDIARALEIDPLHAPAFALQSVIAVAQNEKQKALELARKSTRMDPVSSGARVALSYAQQAHFDIKGALESLKNAVRLSPGNPLAWARLAELRLSMGDLDGAMEAARQAATLNPNLARVQTVLGFAYLTRIDIAQAKRSFLEAIRLGQGDPLPRLGLGLAKIREGQLGEGRREIEIAVVLDPNNSLIRSYLGKAYFEEKSNHRAKEQLRIAKDLDPMDPTPWFYDAIRKQTQNCPVEALEDLQKSIELNGNRAVYRSRLQLDQDLSARSASLAFIYDNLGFQQLALAEGWKSLSLDPVNYSAHRFLADSYAALPRHEIARVSELLQSQLLQPININPVQPKLAESRLFTLSPLGATDASLNEYNSLFNRNRFGFLSTVLGGNNNTVSEEMALSGLWGRVSGSIGQLHYESGGFRDNNDRDIDIYNVFTQVSLSPKTSLQAEYRHREFDRGDLTLIFDPTSFSRTFRQEDMDESLRLGLRHSFTPTSDLLVSLSGGTNDLLQRDILSGDFKIYMSEGQYLYHAERFSIISGLGYYREKGELTDLEAEETTTTKTRHTNFYLYSLFNFPRSVTWTMGASGDLFDVKTSGLSTKQFNPKFGVVWRPFSGTMLRAAAFRTLKRNLLSNQTIEPTNVAGFNQFFDDSNGVDAWRYGVGVDQKITRHLYAGAEFSQRDLTVKGLVFRFVDDEFVIETLEGDWAEQLLRAYLYWAPHPWFALGPEYQFEKFKRPDELMGEESIARLETHRLSLKVGFFHPSGFSMGLKPMYVNQKGSFGLKRFFVPNENLSDHFWVFDAFISYRLPHRWGIITLEGKNLLNKRFQFQDTDPLNPSIIPDRAILGRVTLAF